MIKRKVFAFLCLITIIMPVNYINAASDCSFQNSNNDIKSVIEDFFNLYEDVNLSHKKSSIITENIEKYFVDTQLQKDSETAESKIITMSEPSNLEFIKLLLQRRDIIYNNSDVDLNEYNKKLDLKYIEFNTTDNNATVMIEVTKKWNYSFSPNIESAATDIYTINLGYYNKGWKIENITGLADGFQDTYLNKLGDSIAKEEREAYLDQFEREYIQIKETQKKEETYPYLRASSYNTIAATNYALQYALNPNPNYFDFTSLGGDCTNFISQCLFAGGINMHYGEALSNNCWYYRNNGDRSSSWTLANGFRQYINSSLSTISMSDSNWSSVSSGDIIQLLSGSSAYHSLIITGIEYTTYGRKELLVCAHTTNRRHVALSTYYSGPDKAYYHINGNK